MDKLWLPTTHDVPAPVVNRFGSRQFGRASGSFYSREHQQTLVKLGLSPHIYQTLGMVVPLEPGKA
jgi:hypothetical protein